MTSRKWEPTPLDIVILKMLPEKGSRIGKYLWDGKRANTIFKELDDTTGISTAMIGRHLNELRKHGYVVDVTVPGKGTGKGATGSRGWQITPSGTKLAKKTL